MIKVTVKELRELIAEAGQVGGMWDEKTQSWVPLTKQSAKGSPTTPSDPQSKAGSPPEQKTQQESKVLLDQEPEPTKRDALDDIRTVNQLVMGIRAKLSKVTDPRALRTIAAVVDAVIQDLPTLKQKDQKSGGFATGVRRALDRARTGV